MRNNVKIKIQHEHFKQSKLINFLRSKYILIIFGAIAAVSIIGIELVDGDFLQNAYAKNIEKDDFITGNTIIDEKTLDKDARIILKYYASIIGNNKVTLITYKYSNLYQIEPSLLIALMKVESRFNIFSQNYNTNKSYDRGLFQLNSNAFPDLKLNDFFDPEINIMNGAKHLKWCIDKSNNNLIKALALYNAGIGKLTKKGIGEPTLDYIQKILDEKKLIDAHVDEIKKKQVIALGKFNFFE